MRQLTDLQIRQLFEWVIVREVSKLDGEADELAVTVIAKYQLEFPHDAQRTPSVA